MILVFRLYPLHFRATSHVNMRIRKICCFARLLALASLWARTLAAQSAAPLVAPRFATRVAPRPPDAGECLARFKTNPEEFSDCTKKPCFLFLSQPPYVRLDSRMQSHEQSLLFPCGEPRRHFKFLRGSAFEVMQRTKMGNTSLCVWGGPRCQFNQMVNFIDVQASVNSSYRFGATGLLLENSKRVRQNIIPSVSLLKEQLAFFGPVRGDRDPFPFDQLVRPFEANAWLLWVAACALVSASFWLTACVFGRAPMTPCALIYFLMDTRAGVRASTIWPAATPPEERTAEFEKRVVQRFAQFKMARMFLRIAVSAMCVIFLLFYEIAVVNFLFIENAKLLKRDVRELSERDLREFSVEEGAATEDVWNRTVYKRGKYDASSSLGFPWKRCKTLTQCFDWATDEENDVKFVVGFQSGGMYQVLRRQKCDEMTRYGTERELYSFGAGWLYGISIPESYRREVDKQLADMHEGEELPQIIEKDAGILESTKCSPSITDIDVGVVGASVATLVAPFLLMMLLIMSFFCCQIKSVVKEERTERSMSRKRTTQAATTVDVSVVPKRRTWHV